MVWLSLPILAWAQAPVPPETIGLFRPNTPADTNTFFLRNANTLAPPANTIAGYGVMGDTPVVGDWDGDGIATIGVFRANAPAGSNTFFLRSINSLGVGDLVIEAIGEVGDVPIVGDWDGNGTTTVGLFRPGVPAGSNTVFLWNSHISPPGPPDVIMAGLGAAGDVPLAGDWDGNGTTTIGLFRTNEPAGTNTFFLFNTNAVGAPDITVLGFGAADDLPVAADWDGNPTTTIGLFRPNAPVGTNTFFLLNSNVLAPPAITVAGYGAVGDRPVAGRYGNNPPVVTPETFSVAERSATGTVVGTVAFTDPDNPGQTHTYSLEGGNTDEAFAIDAGTGQLTVANSDALDFVTNPTFNLTVRVTDNGTPVFFGDATVTVNLTDVSDPPVVTAGGVLSYTEGDPATVIDPTVTVTDPDSGTLTQATVQITGNFQDGSDVLACPGCPGQGLTTSYVGGLLTLSGSATLAAYQAALQTVTYENTSNNPTAPGTSRTVTWIANDGAGSSPAVTSTINVTAVNTAPVVTAGGTLNFEENQGASVIDATVTVTDDNSTLASATVQLTGGCVSPEDVLGFTAQGGISGVYTPASCLLTLSGSASPTAYQAALRTVTYQNTSENPSVVGRTVTWIVNDGELTSSPVTSSTIVTAVNDPPTATNKSHDVAGNISITAPAGTLLAGAADPEGSALTAQGDATSVQGGNVTVSADGGYVYNPPAGYEGADSFTFRVCDALALCSAAATVNLTVSGMVWFINNTTPACTLRANGCGRLSSPYSTLAAFAAENNGGAGGLNPAAGDNIFLYESGTAYVGPLTLLNTQRLIGQDASQSLSAITGIAPPVDSAALPGTNTGAPSVTITSAGNGVVLGQNNTLRGLTLGNATGTALSGTDFGTLTLANGTTQAADLAITTTGQALNLTTGTIASVFAGITSSGGTNNISLSGVATTGTADLGGGTLSGATGAAVNVSGGTGSFSYSGNITQSNNAALVSVAGGHATGTLTFSGTLSATNGTGLQFTNADGTYNFTGSTTLSGGDAGIDITNGSGGTFSFNANTTLTNPTGIAYNEDTSTGNVTYNGTITKTNNAANAVNINAKTGGTTSFAGAITASTTTANAIDLTSNTGSIVNFTGGLNLTTTSGGGFNATGGGTVSATQDNTTVVNTITSTTGTALNVANTTIGASGLTFRSILANGGANGIILSSTGALGGLAVAGDGGSCTSAGTCTGGAIQNKTGDGVSLSNMTNANSVTLNNMAITSSGGSHINADTITGLTLNNMFLDLSVGHGVNGTSVRNLVISGGIYDRGGLNNTVCNFNGLFFTNLLGTSTVTSATFRRSNTVQFRVNNNTATDFNGAPDTLTMTDTDWNSHNQSLVPPPNTQCFGDHLSVSSDTGGNFSLVMNASAGINTVNAAGDANGGGIGVQAAAGGTNGKMNASITGLKTQNNTAGVVIANTGSGATMTFNIFENKTANGTGFSGTGSLAIAVTHVSSGTGTTTGTIDDNSITHTAGPGTNALQVVAEGPDGVVGGGTVTARVSNNSISGNFQRGISAQSRLGTTTLNLTLDNNTANGTDTTGAALQVFDIQTGGSGDGHGNTICLNMLNNDATFGPGATYTAAYRLINDGTVGCTVQGCVFRLQDFVGNGSTVGDVQAWVTTPPKSNTTGGNIVSVSLTPPNAAAFTASPGACPVP